MPGYIHYGWLLLQTVRFAPSLWIAVVFSCQFILWLFPILGLVALLTIEKLTRAQNNYCYGRIRDYVNENVKECQKNGNP